MSTFKDYLTESAKSYDYKIKVAGEIADDFASKLESALAKFEVANMSAGKKTPIMTLPLPLSLGGCTASCRLFSLARGGVAFLLFTFPVTTARPGFQVRALRLCVWYMDRFGVCRCFPTPADSGSKR